jgi:Carboxypeptidase regulatory-like domain/TonB dependent receptor-like, beta-barrel
MLLFLKPYRTRPRNIAAELAIFRAALTVAVLLVAGPAFAQQGAAELRGTVVDQQDAVLSAVVLRVRNQETGIHRLARSNPDGTYFVSGLPPGRYEVRASLAGFKQSTQSGIRLEVGRTTTVDLRLIVGPVAESVDVEAVTPLLDTTSKTIGGRIGSEELLGLPSSNRSFVGFIALLPGIVPIPADALGADAFSVNGIDPRSNNFLLDGANNNDDYLGQRAGTQARTPIEAIQEFQVLTHQFDAEFGRATGAVVNAVTRQGSNVFHGSAFSYFQDSRLTSRDFFTRENHLAEPDVQQQHYGGTVGGPVVRNKAHFFFSLEAIRADRATTVNIPSRPDLNAATTTSARAWNTIVRFDHQPAVAHTWGIRWLRDSSPQENVLIPAGGRHVTLNAAREEDDVDQTTVGSLQSVFGNSRLNSLRVAFTRENVAFANPGFNSNGRRQDLLLPTLQYQTFIDQQNDVAAARIDNAWSIEDTVSWFLPARGGSHDLKAGLQYQYARVENTNQGMRNGLFEFRTNTSYDTADPATYPERLQIRVPGASDLSMKGHFVSAFVQDRWRVGDRLTVSLGVRYDFESIPLREADNPGFSNPARYPIDGNNVGPRLGFTYSLDPGKRSVLRGGYGIAYDKTSLELLAPIVTAGRFSSSFIAFFPANGVDPGPSQGRLPVEPMLRNGPIVDWDAIRRLFPPGLRIRNMGTVFFDSPGRRVPRADQISIGYSRQIGPSLAASVDFVHARGRDQLMTRDLNHGVRADTTRTGVVTRVNPEFTTSVLELVNLGRTDYDALEVQLEKRYSRGFSGRVSYTLAYSRGNTAGTGSPQILLQSLDDLRLDANQGPTDFDRRHNFVVSGSVRVPKTGGLTISGIARALSGLPFSLIDSTTDPDRNGILFDFLPAGSYRGIGPNAIPVAYTGRRNGAYGRGLFQLDLRAGYRLFKDEDRTLDLFGEIFNASDRAGFDNPTTAVLGHPAADRRMTDFLVLRSLRPGAIPRTGQVGVRFGF